MGAFGRKIDVGVNVGLLPQAIRKKAKHYLSAHSWNCKYPRATVSIEGAYHESQEPVGEADIDRKLNSFALVLNI